MQTPSKLLDMVSTHVHRNFRCNMFLHQLTFFLSLVDPLPNILILALASTCILLSVRPLGPSNLPTRLCYKIQAASLSLRDHVNKTTCLLSSKFIVIFSVTCTLPCASNCDSACAFLTFSISITKEFQHFLIVARQIKRTFTN